MSRVHVLCENVYWLDLPAGTRTSRWGFRGRGYKRRRTGDQRVGDRPIGPPLQSPMITGPSSTDSLFKYDYEFDTRVHIMIPM